ncbi:hypothetical protein EZS27_024413 [termite gut metagenome]|uniref:Major capsid protein n=1 Tax=termite gut metagenome TaxID=433724 RepID=A0A5J4QZ19_9ZZZZ
MKNLFSGVRVKKPQRNVFDLSHEVKMSLSMGDLVPFLCQEVVPGDTFRCNAEVFMRLAPMIAPIMHDVNIYTHFFFIPNRIIWDDWEDFITGGPNGLIAPVFPTFSSKVFGVGHLGDYFGFPIDKPISGYSILPFRAYDLIYNEYYRDQNLMSEIPLSLSSGVDMVTSMELRRRCWEKDYFTTSLPWPQRGGDVTLPLQGEAPVVLGSSPLGQLLKRQDGTTAYIPNANMGSNSMARLQNNTDGTYANIDPNGTLYADMSQVTATTINDLRRATQLQVWLEKNARGGARYIEQIMSHFGVKSSDARLQRPEFLGGGKTKIRISEVLQSSSTNETSVTGQMAGHGIAAGSSHRFKAFFEEHGIVMGIMSVLPRTAYQQGVPRFYAKKDKFDYFFPEFAHLGEQEVKNHELYYNNDANDNNVFGYQARYSEYKYIPSRVAGEFRSSLNFWHMGRIFQYRPLLNADFVRSNPTTRIFAVESGGEEAESHLYSQVYINLQAVRPMPVYGTPEL